jgi:hypothetical protein
MQPAYEELRERWGRARRAALREVIPPQPPAALADLDARSESDEEDRLMRCALAVDRVATMRRVFENSARLGASFRAFHNRTLELADAAGALAALRPACLRGWGGGRADVDAPELARAGCPRASADVCAVWADAIDGLVLGLTDGARHARHRSAGSGDDRCVDVVIAAPTGVSTPLRHGPIPDEMKDGLAAVSRSARTLGGVGVTFLGVSEGVLFYEVEPRGCGGSDIAVAPLIERGVHRRFPSLKTREISPRAVIDAAS